MLVFLSDDHTWTDSSLYGAPDIPTPQMERIASTGMTFTHAFAVSPSCAPSRAAMLTGLMPARNGAEDNHTYPHDHIRSLVADLQLLGYEVVALGKVGHGPNHQSRRYGFDHHDIRPRYPDSLVPAARRYLENRTSDKPLALFLGMWNPHVPWPEDSSFDPQRVLIPETHLDTPDTRYYRTRYYEAIRELDLAMGEAFDIGRQYLGEDMFFLHSSDHGSQWPFAKWTLYDAGTRVPMIVSWPGMIEPGSWSDAMVTWMDILPTMIEAAGGEVPVGIDGRSFLDVLRGNATEHRKEVFTTASGDRIMNVYPIRAIRTRDWKLIHNLYPEFAFTTHIDLALQPGNALYWLEWLQKAETDPHAAKVVRAYHERPEFELYHLGSDPLERNNLVDDPDYQVIFWQLRHKLQSWMESQNDRGLFFSEPRRLDDPDSWKVGSERRDN